MGFTEYSLAQGKEECRANVLYVHGNAGLAATALTTTLSVGALELKQDSSL